MPGKEGTATPGSINMHVHRTKFEFLCIYTEQELQCDSPGMFAIS